MIMKRLLLLLSLTLFIVVSCTSKNQKEGEDIQEKPEQNHFSVPEIPIMLTTREQQAAYLADHYWDNLEFLDSLDIEFTKIIEEAIIEYLMIIREVEPADASNSVRSLMEKASDNKKLTMIIAEKAEKFLHHPNSPIRNEILYEEFLRGILASEVVEPINKTRFQYQFDMAQKNKPGNKATDFNYTFKDGSRSSLYKTSGKIIMLYFHNPDCHECAATRDRIVNSQIIQKLKAQGILKILAVYPDEDLDLWNKHYAEFPDSWINAYDAETLVQDKELYDLKAIPTIYLLDDSKTVLRRDPAFDQLESYLSSM